MEKNAYNTDFIKKIIYILLDHKYNVFRITPIWIYHIFEISAYFGYYNLFVHTNEGGLSMK